MSLLTHLASYRITDEDLLCLRSILPNGRPLLKHYLFCYCTTVNYLWLCWLPLFILKFTSVVMQSDAKLATTSVRPQNNCSNEDLQWSPLKLPKAFILQTFWVHLYKLVQRWLKANKLGPNAEFYSCVSSLKGTWIWFSSTSCKFGDQCYFGNKIHCFAVSPGQVRLTNPKTFLGKH